VETARMPMHKTDGIFDLISPITLLRMVPNLFTFPITLLGAIITNLLQLVMDYGRSMIEWVTNSGRRTFEVSGRMFEDSFLGRMLHWDVLETSMNLM
jgi:hypothetical protein